MAVPLGASVARSVVVPLPCKAPRISAGRCWLLVLPVVCIGVFAAHSHSFCCTAWVRGSLCGERPWSRQFSRLVTRREHAEGVTQVDRTDALATLGFSSTATPGKSDLKRAFKREVLKSHPDVPGGSPQRFAAVKAAYELLTGRTILAAPLKRGHSTPVPEEVEEDLTDVWTEIGYNPYTGEAFGAQDAEAYGDEGQGATTFKKQPQSQRKKVSTPPPLWAQAALAVICLSVVLSLALQTKGPAPNNQVPSSAVPSAAQPTVVAPPENRVETATGFLEYALPIFNAQAKGLPVVAGGVNPSSEMLRAWITLPEQSRLLTLLEAASDGTTVFDEEVMMRLWRGQGLTARSNYLLESVLSVLYEPRLPSMPVPKVPAPGLFRFHKVVLVVEGPALRGVVNNLVELAQLRMVELEGDEPWTLRSQSTLSNRPVMRLLQPETGQEVLVLGALPMQQQLVVSPEVSHPMGRALPELGRYLKRFDMDALVVNLPSGSIREICRGVGELGVSGLDSPNVMQPENLKAFQRPPWDTQAQAQAAEGT